MKPVLAAPLLWASERALAFPVLMRRAEEAEEISLLEFAATEYGRRGKVLASEEIKVAIQTIGINKCARESGFDRKNFIRKLLREMPVKRNSYNEFVAWLQRYKVQHP